jgi:GAF domain-containing protein
VIAVADDTDIAYESRRVSRLERTSNAAPDLSVASTRSAAARVALREWVNVLAASGGCVDLLDAQERSVRACTYYRFGHDDWTLAEQTYLLSDYPNTARALAERTTYTCRVDDPDADPAEVALLRERGFASLLLTPLVAGGHPLGIVELFDSRHRTFTTDDQRLALSLASHLSALLVRLPHDNTFG